MPRRRVYLVVSVLVVIAVAAALWNGHQPTGELLQQASLALEQQEYAAAESFANQVLSRDAASVPAALLAGRAAAQQNRHADALEYWNRIPDDGSSEAIAARTEAGDVLLVQLKQPSAAEREFRRILPQQPSNVVANDRLAYLLGISARSREAVRFRLKLIELDQFEPVHLFLLCMGDTALENIELLDEFHSAAPGDPMPLLGLARHAMDQQDTERAAALLKQIIAASPRLLEAKIRQGRLLLETAREPDFIHWHASLPAEAEQHAELWVLRGTWALRNSQPESAIRCLWEAVKRDPNHERANYQLGQLLIAQQETQQAQPFLDRSRLLERYFTAVKIAWTGEDAAAIRQAAELAESLGLIWEAYGWYRLTTKHFPHLGWAANGYQQLKPRLSRLSHERAITDAHPTQHLDLSHMPLPRFPTTVESPGESHGGTPALASQVSFDDSANSAGLSFAYFNGASLQQQTRKMYEFNGGGIAILDYDSDGWPDVYLTQGCRWPPDNEQPTTSDGVFRNHSGNSFQDVTQDTRLNEFEFSAGATVGDFNSDGFPDLYVANLGANRFFENNGDGTFTDITDATGTAADAWSSSCVLADLNGDAHPDLYVVNYLTGSDVFSRVCPEGGVVRSCSPRHFPAAWDQLYINRGDESFRAITRDAGILNPDGKGLGIVAADSSGTGRLDLFIANDAVPNFYFVNVTAESDRDVAFREQALLSGLSLNEDGRPEACMGVAAGDANGDGLIDLFVSNFHNESNTLFQQHSEHLFQDSTRQARLHDPSLKLLGFGTQFLDAELDGDLDLFVTNGHIDDFRDTGVPYRMPPQLFANDGTGRFDELKAESLGRFFQGTYLGRGAARVDWNRDGLDDLVISHLHAPVALLTNTSSDVGRYVAVRLVGVDSSRDAIGTVLTAEIQGRTLVRQLTAGDGYQASNERRVIFGLGDDQQIDALHVRWPSGTVQRFDNLSADSDLVLIEGRGRPVVTAGVGRAAGDLQ